MLAACLLAGAASCGPDASRVQSQSKPHDAPDVPVIVKSWNDRAESIEQLYGRGIFQANWVDESGGRHVDQGDIDFWYERPSNVAVRCSKFGDTISLFGSNGTAQWFYDAGSEVLYVGTLDPDQYLLIASQPFSAHLLLNVLGLRAMPDASKHATRWCEVDKCFVVDCADGSKMWLQSGTVWPTRRALLLPDASEMRIDEDSNRRLTVRLPNQPIVQWPILPGSITMTMNHPEREEISSLLVFDTFTGEVEDEPMDRVFDLDHLKQALQPVEVRSLNDLGSSSQSGSQE